MNPQLSRSPSSACLSPSSIPSYNAHIPLTIIRDSTVFPLLDKWRTLLFISSFASCPILIPISIPMCVYVGTGWRGSHATKQISTSCVSSHSTQFDYPERASDSTGQGLSPRRPSPPLTSDYCKSRVLSGLLAINQRFP